MTLFTAGSVNSINRVQNKLRKLASKDAVKLDPIVKKFTEKARLGLKQEPYPPVHTLQKYKRTGRLANSWRKRKIKASIWAVDNSQPYAIFVVGEGDEKAATRFRKPSDPPGLPASGPFAFRGDRWWTAVREFNRFTPLLVEELTDFLMKDFR